MPPLPHALLIAALLSTAIVVSAAPAMSGKVAPSKASSLKAHVKSLMDKKKILRRGKRQVVFDDAVGGDDITEEAIIRRQLSQLSDDELAALANIVRGEIDHYAEPEFVAVPQYEVIEIPDEYLEEAAIMEPYPRDARSIPADWAAVAAAAAEQEMNEPEYIVLPEEAEMEALDEEQDEQELRDRIAEIAQILNERATRRSRLL